MFEQREGLIKSDGMERSRYVGVLPRKKKYQYEENGVYFSLYY